MDALPDDVLFQVQPKDTNKVIQLWSYDCLKKYHEAWKTLLQQHLDAGHLGPSNSTHSSPTFIIPKVDPAMLPCWVNDFRQLNLNMIPNNHPLPCINEILCDCAKGRYFTKLDMTNAFFQTKVHPDDIKWLAMHTPWGLYKWTVMPMGVQNAPAVHQHQMSAALHHLISRICHMYLDDIIIWSQTLEEHERNIHAVLQALRDTKLYCSLKKTQLFCTEVLFLGHCISAHGVKPDSSKIARILNWPVPRSVTDMWAFLGLVCYMADHLPNLTEHTHVLNALTTKAAELKFPVWNDDHQQAFQVIKDLVVSPHCLTMIDHDNPGDNHIFLTCGASDFCTGAILSWGPTWEMAWPVAFNSTPLCGAELNYPVHEKELLTIICALKKWRHFALQCNLSQCQAHWQEYMSQFDLTICYIQGKHNVGADTLSRCSDDAPPMAAVSTVKVDKSLTVEILKGYMEDPFCWQLFSLLGSLPSL
ncbi:hypothetical protein M404DRAFT_31065 [Pisolithus tinctorius Marx 270]|uniref:Reverse transcriptase domain-containing protein n=1 Tax=Pisolithus tinctorius Marx 270 TaxID=870435 RepID=A0A0C3NU14_PISTI|nr:hypothetical protein M404DRAFT_31065 [Pisolithus tinctorius Marx 270]